MNKILKIALPRILKEASIVLLDNPRKCINNHVACCISVVHDNGLYHLLGSGVNKSIFNMCACPIESEERQGSTKDKYGCMHAEIGAIINALAALNAPWFTPGGVLVVYCSLAPCIACATALHTFYSKWAKLSPTETGRILIYSNSTSSIAGLHALSNAGWKVQKIEEITNVTTSTTEGGLT